MEYGLRRYEAIQRLWWLLFFILCLVLANFSKSYTPPQKATIHFGDLKSLEFWTGLQGIRVAPPATEIPKGKLDPDKARPDVRKPSAGESKSPGLPDLDTAQKDLQLIISVMLFLIRAGMIFIELKLVWICAQYAGKYLLQFVMADSLQEPGAVKADLARTSPDAISPRHLLVARIKRIPLSLVLHPFLRLRLMLSGSQKNVSSEELLEKERRIVETDWQILYGSWGPFRWLFWVLPVLGLAQTAWFLVLQFHIASSSQKEIIDQVQAMPNLLLPLVQAAGIAIFFKIAASLLRRFEELYLSNLDAFIYDRLLSRLPLQSNDTVLILETLQSQFKDLHSALRKLERMIQPERKTEKNREA